MEMITRDMLVKEVAEKTETTQKVAKEFVNVLFETIAEHLENGEAVKIPNFVTFEVREYGARAGRNPQTGEAIEIPAHNGVGVKISKNLKERVR